MSEIKLLPCPFCDAELKRWDYMPSVFFEHPYNGCILSGKKVLESEHDINAWNTRKPMGRIAERVHDITKVYLDARNPEESAYVVRKMDVINIIKEEGGIE